MGGVVVSGLLTGWAIAVPVGAVAALIVTLTARTSWRVGAGAALGVASVDAGYAVVAVVAGAWVASLLEPIARELGIVSGLVLLAMAALAARHAVRDGAATSPADDADRRPMTAGRAYVLFLGITALNPATVVYFAAIVLGNDHLTSGVGQAVVFVMAVAVASGSWQLLLATGGAALGRTITGPRGRLVTGLVSAVVIAALAVRTIVTA